MSNIYLEGSVIIPAPEKEAIADIKTAMAYREEVYKLVGSGDDMGEFLANIPESIEYTRPYFELIAEDEYGFTTSYDVYDVASGDLYIGHEEAFSYEDLEMLLELVAAKHKVPAANCFIMEYACYGKQENFGGKARTWCGGTVYGDVPFNPYSTAALCSMIADSKGDEFDQKYADAVFADIRTNYIAANAELRKEIMAALTITENTKFKEFGTTLDNVEPMTREEAEGLVTSMRSKYLCFTY